MVETHMHIYKLILLQLFVHWQKLPRQWSWHQGCWSPESVLTVLSDRGFEFWMILCEAGSQAQ